MRIAVRPSFSTLVVFALAASACADVIGVQDYRFVGSDGGSTFSGGQGGVSSGGAARPSGSVTGSSTGANGSGTPSNGSASGSSGMASAGTGSNGALAGSTGSSATATGSAGQGTGTMASAGMATGSAGDPGTATGSTGNNAGASGASATGSTAGSPSGSAGGGATGSGTGATGSSAATSGSTTGAAGTAPVSSENQTCGSDSTLQTFNAGLTYYQQTSANNCAVPWPSDGMYVALSTDLYDNPSGSSACGKCVQVTGKSGTPKTVVVVDQCPVGSNQAQCSSYHLDLSPTAFTAIQGSLNPGEVNNSPGLSAKFVPCPVKGNIVYSITSSSSQYYLAMVIENGKYGISQVKYRASGTGSWTSMPSPSDADPHWVIKSGPPNPIDFQVTDEWGQVLEDDQVSWSPGQTVTGGSQFATCP